MKPKENTEIAHCNSCGPERYHEILESYIESGSEDDGTSWEDAYQILRCCGCQSVCFRKRQWFSEWDDYEYENVNGLPQATRLIPGIKSEYFPPAVTRNFPAWDKELPGDIRELMRETYTALHSDSRRLAMMGARAIADMAIVKVIGDRGTFKQKLDALVKDGYISAKNRDVLDAALDAGNAASHRGHKVSTNDANLVMDIIENMLQTLFSLSSKATGLRSRIPPRNPSPS